MQKKITLSLLFLLFAGIVSVQSQLAPRDGSLQDLPQIVDFEEFDGLNLSDIYPGWQQGKGYLQPVQAGSAFFRGDVLFGTATATVRFDYMGIKDEWIISPQFLVTENTKVTFKAALTRFWDDPAPGNFSHNDSVSVMVSTDQEGFDFAHTIHSFKMENPPPTELEMYQFDLSEFEGELIHLAFYATNGQEANSLSAFHLDDIEIKDAHALDAMPVELISPRENQCFQEQTPVAVTVRNDGYEAVSTIPVRVRVRGALNTNLYAVHEGTLQPGEESELFVGYIENPPYGEYTLSVSTELPGDTYNYNDELPKAEFTHAEPLELPLPFMNFMGFFSSNLSEVYPGWYEARGKGRPIVAMNTDWQGASYDDARTANVFYTGLGTEDWMVGPKFTATENLVVEMRAAIEYWEGPQQMGSDDKLAIMISTDCGETWEEAAAITQEDNLTTSLQPFTFELGQYDGEDIILAFYATTGSVSDPEQYIIHITDINIKNLFDLDAGVTRLLDPGNLCALGNDEPVTIEVKNFGQQTISGFDVAYVLNDEEPVVETITQSLEYNDVITHTFSTTVDLTQEEENYITVYTLLEGDENPGNDAIEDIPLVISTFDLSADGEYTMGFEEDEDFSAWLVEDGNNDDITWELVDDPAHANSGDYSYAYFSNQSSTQSDDWLFSSCFFLEEGQTYNISFYYRNRASLFPESLKLNMGQGQFGEAMDIELLDLGEIDNPSYMQAEVEFTVDESGEYYFGWHAYGPADQFGMHIDDISIYQVFDVDIALQNYNVPRNKDENCVLEDVEEIDLLIRNVGEQTVNQVDLVLEVDGTDTYEFTVDINIESSESQWISISNGFALDPYQSYNLKIWNDTELDLNSANDTLWIENFRHVQYHMGFEEHEEEEFENWTIQSLQGTSEWFINEGSGEANTGSQSLAIRTDSGDDGDNTFNNDWAITDCFYLEAGQCYEISFYYRSWFSTENLAVYMGEGSDHSDMNELLIDLPEFSHNTYEYVSQQFTVEEDGVYHFGFHTEGDISGRYYIFVDDVSIIEDEGATPLADIQTQILDNEVYFQAHAENYSSLEWDFGDGNTASGEENVFHVYDSPGTYNVTLTLGSGCIDAEFTTTVTLECIMEADFEYEQLEGKTVTFTATNGAAGYEWDFGDGNTGAGATVTHTYQNEEPTTFDVVMTAHFNCGYQTVEKQVYVEEIVNLVEGDSNDTFKAFPNPASSHINITADQLFQRIVLTDVQGRTVRDYDNLNQSSYRLSVENLQTGVYFIQLHTTDGVAVQKLQIRN